MEGGPPHVQTGFTCPAHSRITESTTPTGLSPAAATFPDCSASLPATTGLLRFARHYSRKSLLMSFPPGTEMFQFPGFAPDPMNSGRDTPKGWVSPFGHPRINDRSHLPAAFRSVPRPSSPLAPRHPPNALLSLHILTTARAQAKTRPMRQVSDGSAHTSPRLRLVRPRCAAITSHTRSIFTM